MRLTILAAAILLIGGCMSPSTQTDAPPPDKGPITLWLSARRLPAEGADLVAVLVNKGETSPMFGVGAAVDRWDGSRWTEHRRVALCLEFWNCLGQLQPPHEQLAVRRIGLSAQPGSVGVTEWLRVEGLDAGWYRLRQVANEGDEATGTFEVVDRQVPLASVADMQGKLFVRPPLLAPAGGTLTVAIPAPSTPDGHIDPDSTPRPTATADIQQWSGTDWTTVASIEAERTPESTKGHVNDEDLLVPAVEPGAYRVVRYLSDGSPVPGPFWVTDDIP